MLLRDRREAGQLLSERLTDYAHRSGVLVLALPRGGVPVGFEIAKKLHLPLDICLVRKLGVPEYPELAMGAIATQGIVIINRSLVEELQISSSAIEATIEKEQKEIDRREKAYRGDRPLPIILDQIIILVDDGIATGATIKAAIASLHQQQPQGIIVAVPVASRSCCQDLEPLVSQLICLQKFDSLSAISRAYRDFSQTTDGEVRQFLAQKTQT